MSEETASAKGKGRPTPSRKEQQQARKKPLVGDRSKETRAQDKEKVRAQRMAARH